MALRVAGVDVDGLVEEVEQGHDGGRVCDEMQRVVALCVGDVGIRVVRDEELDHVEVAVARSPLYGRCDEVTAKRINFCTLLEQIPACGGLRVDGSPVQRGDVLLVSICRFRFAGFYELPDCLDVTALCSNEDVDLMSMNVRYTFVNVTSVFLPLLLAEVPVSIGMRQ